MTGSANDPSLALKANGAKRTAKEIFVPGGRYKLLKRLNSAKEIQGNRKPLSLIFFDPLCPALLDLGIFRVRLDKRKGRSSNVGGDNVTDHIFRFGVAIFPVTG
jgi:hypothetical protein